jgi:hypothetical protein
VAPVNPLLVKAQKKCCFILHHLHSPKEHFSKGNNITPFKEYCLFLYWEPTRVEYSPLSYHISPQNDFYQM